MAVGAAGLELVAQGGLVHKDIDQNCDTDGNQDAAIDLRVGEQFIQTQLGGLHTIETGLVDIGSLGVLHVILEALKQAALVEQPGHQVGGDPVGHDAGQHLINVEEGLHQSGDTAPQGAGQHAAQEGNEPHQGSWNRFSGDGECQNQGGGGAHQVLARRANVEQAGLEGHSHRQAGKDQRGGPEEHVAQVRGVKAEGQRARRVASGAEQAAEHQADALPRAVQPQGRVGGAHDDDNQRTHHHADEDGDQRGQYRLGAVFAPQVGKLLLHAPSPSFFIRFAPAI